MKQSFYGGVHPHDCKEATNQKPVTPLSQPPAQVVIPMSMHIGAPCKPLVAKGDLVKVGQKIGEIAGLGAPIHASVSGKVLAVEPRPYTGGTAMSVIIENDFNDTYESALTPHKDYTKLTPEEIVDIVKEAGITGMGGAGFPTHVKISSGLGKVDTIILNGAECEPYVTPDHRLMLEQGSKIIEGCRILMHAFGIKACHIGIEANKMDGIDNLKRLINQKNDVQITPLRTRYPQGAEKQLIQTITGRLVPPGGLPAQVGCAVFNVSTAVAVYSAVVEGKPVTHRILSVTGGAIKNPKNLLAPLGTTFEHIIQEAEGFCEEPDRILTGGPMMGIAQYDMAVPVIKGTNGVLCLTAAEAAPEDKEQACLRCGRCVNVCPMHLAPVYLHLYGAKGYLEEVEDQRLMDCIECGSCQYICPARIPLVQSFRTSKLKLRAKMAKEQQQKGAKS